MGPLLVLVSPCFRKKCKCHIQNCVFLCSLDNFLLKNVIVFFFWKSNFKMVLIWKKKKKELLLIYFSHFFSYQGKDTKNSFSTYPTYIHTHILLTLFTFLPSQILQKLGIYHVWFLFGTTPGVDCFSCPFGAQNGEQNLG